MHLRSFVLSILITVSFFVSQVKSRRLWNRVGHVLCMTTLPAAETVLFGAYSIEKAQIFYESSLCYGLVNLKPIIPGHVLIIPKRVCARFADLTPEEVGDLYSSVHKLAPKLEAKYGCSALNIAMQDGKDAGQSVAHVHVHMLPRKPGDFERNDDVYEELDRQELDKVLEAERKPRTMEQMANEANELRPIFEGL